MKLAIAFSAGAVVGYLVCLARQRVAMRAQASAAPATVKIVPKQP